MSCCDLISRKEPGLCACEIERAVGLSQAAVSHHLGLLRYARQDEFWISDPDGNRWEIYTVLEDVEEEPRGETEACCAKEVSAGQSAG